jgi:serine/threonine protein kinase
MDVKPSNICIDHAGNFVLIDFGSAVEFGNTSQSTLAYIPHGVNSKIGSAFVDWWMLAATLTNRACGCRWGLGARNPTQQETLEMLKRFPEIFEDIKSLLQQ